MKHTPMQWLVATRPWSFTASIMPVVVTLAYLNWLQYDIDWLNGLWAVVNITFFHAAGNTWSDYFDYKRNVDAKDTYGVRILTDGMFTPTEIYRFSVTLIAVAVVGGVLLMLRSGWPLLLIGLGGAVCSLLYPTFKYNALGEVAIFAAYAFLPAIGTSYVAVGQIDWSVAIVGVPVGLITVAILHANNTRDIRTDARARIRTVAMAVGHRMSKVLYAAEVLLPFVIIPCLVIGGTLPAWTMLILPALLPAIGNVQIIRRSHADDASSIAVLDEMTAKLQFMFSALLTVSLLVAAWIA